MEASSLSLIAGEGSPDIPLGFLKEGDAIYLVAKEKRAKWPASVLRSGVATLGLGESKVRGAAELVTDRAERDRILSLFLKKYGKERYERWYSAPYRVLRVSLRTLPVGGDARHNAHYYEWLRDEFDNIAFEYDRHIFGNRINSLMRERSLELLRRTFASSKHLLEIGCGSGTETLSLLKEGHELVAIDISGNMLEVIREKAQREGVSERLRTIHMPAREVGRLFMDFGESSFDGAYSTFGALNSEPGLDRVPPGVHRLLRDSSRFIAGVYNRWCLFELAGYALKGKWGRALDRLGSTVPVGGSRFCIDVFSYSAMELERIFRPHFAMEGLQGVPVILPPSDFVRYLDPFSRHIHTLEEWDGRIGHVWPFNHLGDHYLMTLRRRE